MSPHSVMRILFAVISLALVAGCNDSTAPITSGTKFVLVRIGEDALPALTSTGPGARVLIADTLFFAKVDVLSGKVEHHQTVQFSSGPVSSSYDELYSMHDGLLIFSLPPCPPNANCTLGFGQPTAETGRFGPGILTITYDSPLVPPRTYRRVD